MRQPPIAAITGIMILLSSLGHPGMASFPFNGSFEVLSGGKPLGWEMTGSWFVRPDAASHGRNGICVFGAFGKKGAQMITNGYLFAYNEPVWLSFTYSSPTGHVEAGLLFCDSLGNPIADGAWESLPPTETSRQYQREIVLPQYVEGLSGRNTTAADGACCNVNSTSPLSYSSIRLVFRIEQDGAQIKFDDVILQPQDPVKALPKPPAIKAEIRPNLLRNGRLAVNEEGFISHWLPLRDESHFPELVRLAEGEEPQQRQLALKGEQSRGAAWLADPVMLDGALPYQLEANVYVPEGQKGAARLLVRLLHPIDDRAVWMQESCDLLPGQDGPVTLALPRLSITPLAVRACVAIEMPPGQEGEAYVRAVALRPEPLSVSVRTAAGKKGFRRLSDAVLFVAVINNTTTVLKPKAILEVFDEAGQKITGEIRPIVVGARSAAYFPYRPKLTQPGSYNFVVKIMQEAKELSCANYNFQVGEQ